MFKNFIIIKFLIFGFCAYAQNPFLRPGSDRPKPVIQRPTPPPPPPQPPKTNLKPRGGFQFKDGWGFLIFVKRKNKGVWLKKGDSFDDGKVEIESFNPDTEVVKLKGGFTLSLKKSENKILSVPSGMPVKKPAPKASASTKPKPVPRQVISPSGVRKIVTSSGKTITIPPRNPSIPPKK